jgi:hypothetical protein
MTTLSLHFPVLWKSPRAVKTGVLPKVVLMAVLCLILFLLGLYLFQAGELTKSSYLIKSYGAEVEKLASGNVNLQGESINLLSLAQVEEKAEEFDFVKVEGVKYIPITVDYLVKKNR